MQLPATLEIVAAALPVVLLGTLVVWRRWALTRAGWFSLGIAVLVALGAAGLDATGLAVAVGKGAWTGGWILLIVVPALLVYELVQRAGALARLSEELGRLAGTKARQLLLFAWTVPSFVQGVAGFGVPIVVAAPMLVAAGFAPAAAIAAVLVGYHWSVTFGSMGSSFFVAAGTAELTVTETARFALLASSLLAVNALLAGLLLLRRAGPDGGARGAILPLVVTAVAMGSVLVGVAAVQPALGSTAAGLAGVVVLALFLRRGGGRVSPRPLALAAAPYAGLTLLVVVAFGVPPVRELLARVPTLAPSFPATTTDFGERAAVAAHQPFDPLLHPWIYLLAIAFVAWAGYRLLGWLPPGEGRAALAGWATRGRKTAASLLGLTILAAVMVEAGLVSRLAEAFVAALGPGFAAISPVLGALGTAVTGSTTASNALLAPLQAGAADQLGADMAAMLTGQTAGGNVGNALTPLNVAIAAGAVGATGEEGAIIRDASKDAVPLLVLAAVATTALVWLL
ncbi:L-lactate permease [Egibacter rhizosphaerae]|uniref:L-lactate permease n=1 Tax=Egibacter rhizosphaerae TaxID=1670831 RepID=UPI0013F15E93|nr:L-lactate permease [Egibacter rhizosphaerae]